MPRPPHSITSRLWNSWSPNPLRKATPGHEFHRTCLFSRHAIERSTGRTAFIDSGSQTIGESRGALGRIGKHPCAEGGIARTGLSRPAATALYDASSGAASRRAVNRVSTKHCSLRPHTSSRGSGRQNANARDQGYDQCCDACDAHERPRSLVYPITAKRSGQAAGREPDAV